MAEPAYLRLIDQATRGPRCDVTPIFGDARAFAELVADLAQPFQDVGYEAVAGIDALGFVLGAAIALRERKAFVPIRKGGKLPVEVDGVDFVDYTGDRKSLELRVGAVRNGIRVLLVDEWVETAAQVRAAIRLLERQGAIVVGVAAIEMDDNETVGALSHAYRCHAVSGWLAKSGETEPRS